MIFQLYFNGNFNLFQIKPCNLLERAASSPLKFSRCEARAGSPFKFFKVRPCAAPDWRDRGAYCGPPLALAARRERRRFAIQFCIQITPCGRRAPARRARLSRSARRSSESLEGQGAERRWQRAEPLSVAAVEDPLLHKAVAVAHYNTR